mmetsp:Transcript_73675/g.85584  ORF Transcript_73675/g.85584 Transcript_73675/m.85584 type:complete len:111 (+) Transcript_73675:62-394(+)
MSSSATAPTATATAEKTSKAPPAAAAASSPTSADADALTEVIPKTGLVYSEKSTMVELLCKPKVMAIKSASLLRLEELEKEAIAAMSAAATHRAATSNGVGAISTSQRIA